MGDRSLRRKYGLVLASGAALIAATGCTYLRNRGRDALDMFDIGVTWTKKPQFGLYANCPVLAPGGYGKVDGHFAGVGGGRVGVMKHHQDNVGLLVWGREKEGWGEFRKDDAESMHIQEVGPAGMLKRSYDDPACKHYFHVGYVGLAGNVHYGEIGDFFLGWFGADICRDDGKERGKRARPRELARAQPRPKTDFCPRCGGRRLADAWPPVPTIEAPSRPAAAAEKEWAGRWCDCWKEQTAEGGKEIAKRPQQKDQEPERVRALPLPETEFCLRCGGRRFVDRWPPVPGVEPPSRPLSAAEKQWAGRWCECWKSELTGAKLPTSSM